MLENFRKKAKLIAWSVLCIKIVARILALIKCTEVALSKKKQKKNLRQEQVIYTESLSESNATTYINRKILTVNNDFFWQTWIYESPLRG